MTKGQTGVLIVVALLVLGGLVWLASQQPATAPSGDQAQDTPAADTTATGSEPVGEEAAPGASPVSEEGQVVNEEGSPTDTAAEPDSENAPQQSDPVSEEEVPDEAVKLGVSASGYDPGQFSVQSGAAVTVSVTSRDDQTHIFKFRDETMQGVAVGVSPGETRVVSFNAPAPGEYDYFCDVPGHDARGENGVMIVE